MYSTISCSSLCRTALDCSVLSFPVRTELRVVWADEFNNPDAIRMSMRLVEDSIHGTYVLKEKQKKMSKFMSKFMLKLKLKLEKMRKSNAIIEIISAQLLYLQTLIIIHYVYNYPFDTCNIEFFTIEYIIFSV